MISAYNKPPQPAAAYKPNPTDSQTLARSPPDIGRRAVAPQVFMENLRAKYMRTDAPAPFITGTAFNHELLALALRALGADFSRASAMRVCQPGPVAFHRAMILAGKRNDKS